MIFCILATFFCLWFRFFNNDKSRREIFTMCALLGISFVWGSYMLMDNDTNKILADIWIGIVFIFAFCIFVVAFRKMLTPLPINVVARQECYWGIKPSIITDFFIFRRDNSKKKRVDIQINGFAKVWQRKYGEAHNESYMSANVFLDYENLHLTKLNKIDDIAQFGLYNTIFARLKKIITEKEIDDLDMKEVLERNGNFAEYFLLDLWECYTQDINIGVAGLEVYAKRDIERQLIRALNNIDLNSISRNGAALLYSYLEFRDKLPQEQEAQAQSNEENKESTNQEYEEFE